MHTNDPKLTTANAAPYCGYSERHFIRMRQQGEGPPYLRLKGKVFYRQSDLDAWLNSKRVVPPRETELLREEADQC